jgi:hypothetical protein
VSIESNAYLARALERARAGATLDEVARAVSDADVSLDEARQYAGDLVDNQVLVSELEPSITDPQFLDSMIAETARMSGAGGARTALAHIRTALADPSTLLGAVHAVAPGVSADMLRQVDYCRPATLTLGPELKTQLLAGLDALRRLVPQTPKPPLVAFHALFRERFGNRQVPLLRALDADIGLPYGQHASAVSPLLEGLEDLGAPARPSSDDDKGHDIVERQLLPAIQRVLDAGGASLELDEALVSRMPAPSNTLPPTFSLMFSVVTVDGRPAMALRGAGGTTATAAIGRFASLDAAIDAHARQLAAHEAAAFPGRLVAELLHLPEDRHVNVLLHPPFRGHEIPCLARASVDRGHQLALDDLTLSAEDDGRLTLRSVSHGREVIPMLSHAHRFTAPELLPAYRLLADLQAGGANVALGLPLDWLFTRVPRLPRLVHRGCILSPARWRFEKAAMEDVMAQVPRRVRLIDTGGDAELALDLGDDGCRELLAVELRAREACELVEDLFAGAAQWITGPDGGYANEVIAAVLSDGAPA